MTDTTSAAALTEEALTQLRTALDDASDAADFLAEADYIVAQPEHQLALPTDLGAPEPLDTENVQGRDVDNGPKVYEYLGAMDRVNAADGRLWTFLAFSTYRSYMDARWPLSGLRNWQSRVEDRWLITRPTRGRLIRHGIARLWWVTALTHDARCVHPLAAHSKDPFAYTRAVLRNEDRILALFDREVGAASTVVRSILEHLEDGPKRASEQYVRDLMKEVTLVYGFRDLATLDADALNAAIAGSAPATGEGSLSER